MASSDIWAYHEGTKGTKGHETDSIQFTMRVMPSATRSTLKLIIRHRGPSSPSCLRGKSRLQKPHAGGNGGGTAASASSNSGTFSAAVHADMPCRQTSVLRLIFPLATCC